MDHHDFDHKGVEEPPDASSDLDREDEYEDSIFDPTDRGRDASTHSSAPTSVTSAPRSATPSRKRRKKIHPCPHPECGKTYTKASKLEEHYRIHTNDRPFVCPTEDCFKTFLRKEHLQRHVTAAHTDVRRYVCDWEDCDKGFITATRLKRHKDMHKKNEETQYACRGYGDCDRIFRKQETLDRHINTDHLGVKAYQCGEEVLGVQCDASFDTRNAWKAHLSRVHGTERYWCDICEEQGIDPDSEGFVSYADLQRHTLEAHPPICEFCNQIFTAHHKLRDHINTTHNALPPDQRHRYFCPEAGCGRGFTRQSNMKTHMRSTHQRKKPFVCGETDLSESHDLEFWDRANACGASFTTKQSLERHARTKHVGKIIGRGQSAGQKRKREPRTYQQPEKSVFEQLTGMRLEDIKKEPGDDVGEDLSQFWIGGLSDVQPPHEGQESRLFEDDAVEPDEDAEYAPANSLLSVDPALRDA